MLNINNSSNLLINTSFNRGNYLQIMATVNNDAKFCKNGDASMFHLIVDDAMNKAMMVFDCGCLQE